MVTGVSVAPTTRRHRPAAMIYLWTYCERRTESGSRIFWAPYLIAASSGVLCVSNINDPTLTTVSRWSKPIRRDGRREKPAGGYLPSSSFACRLGRSPCGASCHAAECSPYLARCIRSAVGSVETLARLFYHHDSMMTVFEQPSPSGIADALRLFRRLSTIAGARC
jgi:hypothetical protein